MRIYHLNLLVHDRMEVVAEDLFRASALVRAECPYESLFFLRNHLEQTQWNSYGREEIIIAPAHLLETELSQKTRKDWRQVLDPTLQFRVADLSLEQEDLALSA